MMFLTAAGFVILAFFLYVAIHNTDPESQVPGWFIGLIILIISGSGFMIGAGLFA